MKRSFFAAIVAALAACSLSPTTPSPAKDSGGVPIACAALGAPASVVAPGDPLGYPAYGLAGCRLAYVDAATKNLLLRDLSTGVETTLDLAQYSPRRPSVSNDVVAWEASENGRAVVRVFYGDATVTLSSPNAIDHLGEPSAATSSVAVTGWKALADSSDTDVFIYDASASSFTAVATGPAQQRFSAASDDVVLVTDFSEDPKGYYTGDGTDLADIAVYDKRAHAYAVRHRPGKQAFPAILSKDVLGYLEWGDVHPEPKLEAYSVYDASLSGDPTTDAKVADVTNASRFLRPSASSGVLEWVTLDVTGAGVLWRATQGSAPTMTFSGSALDAPVSAAQGTLVASGGTLQVVAR